MTNMDECFEKIKKPNPQSHYFAQPKEIEVEAIKISEREIIEKVELPNNETRYSHQYKKENKWELCRHCGDLAEIPKLSCGGPQHSVEHIKKYCSKYGTY
ncbi:MAG: hypothetical protein L6420_01200 [Elusimicrobia bacterium]|nr:hypothetical protein [Elusimicrobiota bacterium]